jgi:MFS family permease
MELPSAGTNSRRNTVDVPNPLSGYEGGRAEEEEEQVEEDHTPADVRHLSTPTIGIACCSVAVILYNVVGMIRSTIFLWFARTLIHCPASPGTANQTAKIFVLPGEQGWSGSHFCTDVTTVADQSQVVFAAFNTCNTLFALICVPALGGLSDRVGRRPMLLMATLGTTAQVTILAFAALRNDSADSFGMSFFLVLLAAAVQGSTAVFASTITTMIVDVKVQHLLADEDDHEGSSAAGSSDGGGLGASPEDAIGKAIGILQGVKAIGTGLGAGLGFWITSLSLEYYGQTFFGLVVPCVVSIVLVRFAPETLTPKKIQRRRSLIFNEDLTPDFAAQLSAVDLQDHQDLASARGGFMIEEGKQGIAVAVKLSPAGRSSEAAPPSGSTARVQASNKKSSSLRQQSTRAIGCTNQTKKCATYPCCRRGGFCSPMRLVLESGTLSLVAAFIFMFVLGGSCLTISQSFTVLQFGWTSTESTLAFMGGGGVGLISLFFAGCIIPKLGSLQAILVASMLATVGCSLMAMAPLSPILFMIGMLTLCSSSFGAVAYLQFISARVDVSQMGAIQGALSASGLMAYIIGSNLYTALSVGALSEARWACYLIGAGLMAVACGLVAILFRIRIVPTDDDE